MKSLLPRSEMRLCLQRSFKSAREEPRGSQSSFVREILTGTTELLRDKPTAAPALFGSDSGADFPRYPAGSAPRSGTSSSPGPPAALSPQHRARPAALRQRGTATRDFQPRERRAPERAGSGGR